MLLGRQAGRGARGPGAVERPGDGAVGARPSASFSARTSLRGRDQHHREEHEPYDKGGERYLGRMDEEEQDDGQERQEDGWIAGTMVT